MSGFCTHCLQLCACTSVWAFSYRAVGGMDGLQACWSACLWSIEKPSAWTRSSFIHRLLWMNEWMTWMCRQSGASGSGAIFKMRQQVQREDLTPAVIGRGALMVGGGWIGVCYMLNPTYGCIQRSLHTFSSAKHSLVRWPTHPTNQRMLCIHWDNVKRSLNSTCAKRATSCLVTSFLRVATFKLHGPMPWSGM